MKEQYIKRLYRGVLMREADADGLAAHLRHGEEYPSFEFASELLDLFLESNERQELERKIALRSSLDLALDNVPGYSSVISIGSHCVTAGEIKRFGLKKSSYPFDWIFSNVAMVADCIKDDFEKFLDRRYHKAVPVEERRFRNANYCQHTYYLERFGINFVFNHRDITSDEDFAYYSRCVERFRAVLNGNEPTLFLGLVGESFPAEHFDHLSSVLDRYEHIDLALLSVSPRGGLSPSIQPRHRRKRDQLFDFQSLGRMGPNRLEHGVDEMILREFLKNFAIA
ncbi:hypothetical protein G3N58_24295 [Paraburkholderia sp. Ac-20342]|uniref:DUF1796 family putative cysteine peptidase n=1 Tax=Paraburkholderia sp. Ac-20342 TaxID=2703889 RepID=UPI001981BBE4|nr:DUF1796 family putative cysteine peptidase [Paraburkholderia sp. Ac-20342]MBN3849918.1 hypothetical protein [Paraburkholderia sp. Ac-20342]